MSTVVVQAKIDKDLKESAEKLLNYWGLDTATAIRIFMRKIVQTRSIPFDIGWELDEDGFFDA